MTNPFVVIGGDAAGLSAASKLRREDPDRDVIVFEKGAWVSYAHCGMPYYVKGVVDSLTDLLSLTPDEIDERGIDLRRCHEVVQVDPADRTVTVQHESGETVQPYGELLIATGAHALTDPIPGTALECAFTMHHMDSAAAIRAYLTPSEEAEQLTFQAEAVNLAYVTPYLDRDPPDSVAIVGGGYVGVEMAEAFSAHEVDVHLFQRSEDLLPPFGEAVAEQIEETLRSHGVALHLGTEVQGLEGEREVRAVRTEETRIPTDLALVGIGIRPNTQMLEDAPIELGGSGAVRTDPYGRTSVERVYAAGDCAEMEHTVTGEPTWVPLGLTANRAGRAIGQTIAGTPTPVGTVAGTAVVKAFEQECGRTGLVDQAQARDAGFTPVSETITASSRSGYYPGAKPTTVSLMADADSGRLLGGSIVGPDRAAIRIDILATALDQNMDVGELERLDLAYAPPFSPVWDPILVAAKVLNGAF